MDAFQKQQRQKLVRALENILQDRVGLTQGCREVVDLGHSIGLETPLFDPFRGFESETDRFPVGDVRQQWSAEGLEEMDRERAHTEAHYRDWISEAARKLQSHIQEQN